MADTISTEHLRTPAEVTAEASGDLAPAKLLRIALKNELEASEIAAINCSS